MVFEVFRSRQKELLVALTLLAMFAFVFAGVFEQLTSREFSGGDLPLATAWGRDITIDEVQRMQQERNIANQFIMRALRRVGSDRPIAFDPSPQGVIQAITILGKADEMGIVTDDSEVTRFINDLTQNRLSKGDFQAVLSGTDSEGNAPLGVSERELYRILARELKILMTVSTLTPPVLMDTPYEMWADREVANTKVKLDLAKISVEKFTSEVGEPTEEQLKKTYDQFKEIVPDPEAGIIGFRQPHRVKAQYFVAKVDNFLSKVSVTPEEMKKYYDEHPDEFLPEPPAPPATTPVEEEAVPMPPSEESATEETPVPPQDSEAEDKPMPPSEEKQAEPKAESEAEEPQSNADTKPTDESPEASDANSETPQAGLKYFLQTVAGTGTYLLAQDEKGTTEENAEPKTEEKAETDEKTNPELNEKPERDESAKPAEATEPTPTETEQSPVMPAEAPTSADPPKVDAPSAPRPFEEVKDKIEKTLLRQKAGDYIVGNMQKVVLDVLQPYLDKYLEASSSFDAKKGETFTPPPVPDLAAVAAEYGFELKTTDLITQEEAAEIEGLGSATRAQRSDNLPFSIAVFDQKVFRPRVVESTSGDDFYLYWKIEDVPAKTPPYEEVKEQVLTAWRIEAAGPLAKEAAEKLAEAARAEGANFSALVADAGYSVETTKEFTRYLTQPNPMLGQESWLPPEVPELPDAGPELFNEIFKMSTGEIKVVSDARKQNYYVVKLLSRTEPEFDKFIQHYSMEVGFLRDPSFLAQRQEFQIQRELTRRNILIESGLKLTTTGEEYLGATPTQ